MEPFKIRASAAGTIVAGQLGLTDIQHKKMLDMQAKDKLTPKQEEELSKLVHKHENPEISKGIKTYCQGWLKNQLYQRNKQAFSKYFDKGNVMEDSSIENVARYFGLGMIFKNEDYFDNDDSFCGTPDVLLIGEVIDMKNPWDYTTFPLFDKTIPNIDYYWQLQVYMHLTGRKKARLIYYLSDTPENLIEREAWSHCKKLGMEELDPDILAAYTAKMTYDDVAEDLKIKVFEIEYNPKDIELLQDRVKLCRKYIKTLMDDINIK